MSGGKAPLGTIERVLQRDMFAMLVHAPSIDQVYEQRRLAPRKCRCIRIRRAGAQSVRQSQIEVEGLLRSKVGVQSG